MKNNIEIYKMPRPYNDYKVATITNKVKRLNIDVISFILIKESTNEKEYMFGLPKETIKNEDQLLEIIANNLETYIKIMEEKK